MLLFGLLLNRASAGGLEGAWHIAVAVLLSFLLHTDSYKALGINHVELIVFAAVHLVLGTSFLFLGTRSVVVQPHRGAGGVGSDASEGEGEGEASAAAASADENKED